MTYDNKTGMVTFESGTTVYAYGGELWPAGDSGFSYGSDGGVDLSSLTRADALEAIAEAEKSIADFRARVETLPDWYFFGGGENPALAASSQEEEGTKATELHFEISDERWMEMLERRNAQL